MSTEAGFISTAATSLVTTAETAVLTFTVPPENQPTGQGILFTLWAVLNSGAGATAVILRLRQGVGTGGAVVGTSTQEGVPAATNGVGVSAAVIDPQLSYPAGNTYTMTAQQVGATGNGTMVQAIVDTAPITAVPG